MKRRLILVLASFLVLLVAFGVYWAVSEKEGFFRSSETSLKGPSRTGSIPTNVNEPLAGKTVLAIDRDDSGRLRGIYRAQEWQKISQNDYQLVNPSVEYHPKKGRRMYLWADEGTVTGEMAGGKSGDVGGKLNIRSGKLWGNVRIVVDTQQASESDRLDNPEQLAASLEERSRELIRIFAEDVAFNNDRLLLETDNRVAVLSPQADVYGKGLLIQWNQEPRELRLLRLQHGEEIVVKHLPPGLRQQMLPGVGEGPAVPPPAPQTASAAALAPTSSATKGSATAGQTPQRPPINIYKATFEGTDAAINVEYGETRMLGATKLSLLFEWDNAWRMWEEGEKPASQPAPTASPRPQAASAPLLPPKPDKSGAMFITWRGPMTIVPMGHTDTPRRDHYDVAAEGAQVVLGDAKSAALCQAFEFHHPAQSGLLRGSPDAPVRLEMSDGSLASGELVTFDRQASEAKFQGPGQMLGKGGQLDFASLTERSKPPSAPAVEPAEGSPDRIRWRNYALIHFIEDESQRDPNGGARVSVKDADFDGEVELTRSSAGEGEMVKSRHLWVEMAKDPNGKDYPRKAKATGDVVARQQGSAIEAQKVNVDFELEQAEDLEQSQARRRIKPVRLEAETLVHAVYADPNDPNAPPVDIRGDRLTSDLLRHTHDLFGSDARPARVSRGTEALTGKEVHLVWDLGKIRASAEAPSGEQPPPGEEKRQVSCKGAGTIEFMTPQSLTGQLPQPLPAVISWKDGMDYDDGTGTANFLGKVVLDIGKNLDHMECNELTLLLEKETAGKSSKEASSPLAAQAAPAKPAIGLLGGTGAAGRKIVMVIAKDKVKVRSPQWDADGNLQQRVLLTAEKRLLYDAKSNRMDVSGPGSFTAEDYRPPGGKDKAAAAPADSEVPQRVEKPWQTDFEWNDLMTFSRSDGNVFMQGEVFMNHRSGRQILLADKIRHPPWGDLPQGRATVLTCQTLTADFPPPQQSKADKTKSVELGQLDRFTATGNVHVRDGSLEKTEIDCQRLLYDRQKDFFRIFGSLPGQKLAPALVSRKLVSEDKPQVFTGQEILYLIQSKTVKIVNAAGGGRR